MAHTDAELQEEAAQAYAVENAQTLMHYTQLERARRGTKQQRSAS